MDNHAQGARVSPTTSMSPGAAFGNVKIVEGGIEGGVVKVDVLPSPEELKGRVLLKVSFFFNWGVGEWVTDGVVGEEFVRL